MPTNAIWVVEKDVLIMSSLDMDREMNTCISLVSVFSFRRINGFANPVFPKQLVFYLDILMACVTFGGTVDSQVTQKAVQICHFVLNSG